MSSILNINLKVKIDKFSLGVGLFFILVSSLLLIFHTQINSITAQPTENKKNEKNNGVADFTTIKIKMNLNNIDIKNQHDRLKIVGYLNGEGQTTYVDLKENKNKINLNDNSLTIELKFNKSNDISQVMFDDEYYVCGYLMDDKLNASTTTTSNLPLYDCDEGNIGLTSTEKDTVKLFYTLKKFSESNMLYKTNSPSSSSSSSTKESPKEVKLRIDVPIHDNKKINDMYVVAMIKGEYQIKKIDAQNEIEKGNKKSNSERLS
ncbi:MAG: hypothetical protein QOK89_01865, partial [Nitrososphaeraceae archaeon]|nr:hypothetical protein [Nitrososphaeraceae archaeon]